MHTQLVLLFLSSFSNASKGEDPPRMQTERRLSDIAKDIPRDRVADVGQALKFSYSEIQQYEETNLISGVVTSKGTIKMFMDWRDRTSPPHERKVHQALEEANLKGIAEDHLSMPTPYNRSWLRTFLKKNY